jgi:hypothetical protein
MGAQRDIQQTIDTLKTQGLLQQPQCSLPTQYLKTGMGRLHISDRQLQVPVGSISCPTAGIVGGGDIGARESGDPLNQIHALTGCGQVAAIHQQITPRRERLSEITPELGITLEDGTGDAIAADLQLTRCTMAIEMHGIETLAACRPMDTQDLSEVAQTLCFTQLHHVVLTEREPRRQIIEPGIGAHDHMQRCQGVVRLAKVANGRPERINPIVSSPEPQGSIGDY